MEGGLGGWGEADREASAAELIGVSDQIPRGPVRRRMVQPGDPKHLPGLPTRVSGTSGSLLPALAPRRTAPLEHGGRIVPDPLRKRIVEVGAGQADIGQRAIIKFCQQCQALAMLPSGDDADHPLLQAVGEIGNRHGILHRDRWPRPALDPRDPGQPARFATMAPYGAGPSISKTNVYDFFHQNS